jgi:hypothetical protein
MAVLGRDCDAVGQDRIEGDAPDRRDAEVPEPALEQVFPMPRAAHPGLDDLAGCAVLGYRHPREACSAEAPPTTAEDRTVGPWNPTRREWVAAAKRPGRIGTLPPVGAADRLRSWGRRVWSNPWLLVGIIVAFLLICAWIGWAVHVWSENGARQGLGVLIVWPAIVAVPAVVSIPFVWAFRVIRTSARSPESGSDIEPDASDAETS